MKNFVTVQKAAIRELGVNINTLKVGQLATILPGYGSEGDIVFATRDCVVSLTDPSCTWAYDNSWGPNVRLMVPGDSVTIRQGFTQEFEDEVRKLRDGGDAGTFVNRINAIKHVREVSGWGLKEAKEYVDNLK